MIDRAKALNDKRPLTLFAVRLRWQTNSILCKNPMNLVSVSEQEYYKKLLAAGCALAEIKKEIETKEGTHPDPPYKGREIVKLLLYN